VALAISIGRTILMRGKWKTNGEATAIQPAELIAWLTVAASKNHSFPRTVQKLWKSRASKVILHSDWKRLTNLPH